MSKKQKTKLSKQTKTTSTPKSLTKLSQKQLQELSGGWAWRSSTSSGSGWW